MTFENKDLQDTSQSDLNENHIEDPNIHKPVGETLIAGTKIRNRWIIDRRLGSGGFGDIYSAVDNKTNSKVAIKIEYTKLKKQNLRTEVDVLGRLKDKPHFCDLIGSGTTKDLVENFNFIVMSICGKNLGILRRQSPTSSLSMETSILLAIQMNDSIQLLHNQGFIHRDIKPSNFAMGGTLQNNRILFMLDFGLSRRFLDKDGKIKEARKTSGFRGTIKYASLAAHQNKDLSRQDDLWSLFYVIIEFIRAHLPWRQAKDKIEAGKLKEEFNCFRLSQGLPKEIETIAKHLSTLKFEDAPNYDEINENFKSILSNLNIEENYKFDWENGYFQVRTDSHKEFLRNLSKQFGEKMDEKTERK